MVKNKTLIFIPTYNEVENVEKIYHQIKELSLKIDILFLDDNSPDGTGMIIDRLAAKDPKVYVIHREKKSGIGSAHLDGIDWAYKNAYQTLITMDSDFSHSPRYLPEFIEHSRTSDIVVGSRYMKQGSLGEWSLLRKFLTYTGHFLTTILLDMPHDATGAYRLYRLDKIPQDVFSRVESKGYSFFFESLFVLRVNGFSIKEFPIHLPARTYGHSKMRFTDVFQSVARLVKSCLRLRLRKASLLLEPSPVPAGQTFVASERKYTKAGRWSASQVQADWDSYWSRKKSSTNAVYDVIASFYRTLIIKRSLNHFIKRTFPPGASLLHAGCGGGQVDVDLSKTMKISAMDISLSALNIYKRHNRRVHKLIHGDIFHIPEEDATFDGIYNLGVMEHFTEEEIRMILAEFRRVLKPHGKMVLFWPPEFGISVRFLDGVHFLLNKVFGKSVQLHPPEITRVKSKAQVKQLCERDGLSMVDYYFGPKDFFTQSVVILSKDPALDEGAKFVAHINQ